MRNTLFIISALAALLAFAPTAQAKKQDERRAVRVTDFEVVQEMGNISVDFVLKAGKKATRSRSTLTIIPMLIRDSIESCELAPVLIWGKQAKTLYDRRFIASPGTTRNLSRADITQISNGETVHYHASIPFEEWMVGSTFTLDGVDEGCCSAVRTNLGDIAQNVIVPESDFFAEEETVIPGRVLSTGEKLSQIFPFVRPLDSNEIYSRQGVKVYFDYDNADIDLERRDNHAALLEILSVVREIESSSDNQVDHILIAGFASPEGSGQHNLALSKRRAEAVRKFLRDNSSMRNDRLRLHIGGEDWEGLRELVAASSFPEKQEVLNIIDNTPTWDPRSKTGREKELLRLRGGETWRTLIRDHFPDLRNAAYITVYYK
jgi:outer membrane protein OmpA-like peptidoglycan-associated protein